MQVMPGKFNHVYIIFISFISAFGGYLFGFDFAVISESRVLKYQMPSA